MEAIAHTYRDYHKSHAVEECDGDNHRDEGCSLAAGRDGHSSRRTAQVDNHHHDGPLASVNDTCHDHDRPVHLAHHRVREA